MLEDVEVSRSFMKRMKSTGGSTDPWGTQELMQCISERKPSTLTAIEYQRGNYHPFNEILVEAKHQ